MPSKASINDLKNLITIRNGARVPSTFSAQEYQRRQAALRGTMAAAGIDAVIFTSIHNINYYSDFLYCSFGRPYALVVTQGRVVSVSANIDGGQPWRRTVGDDNVVYTDWQRDNYFRALQQEVPNRGRVGVEFDHITMERLSKLKAALPNAEIVDIAPGAMRLRMVKSAEEIALIKNGAAVCDVGGAALAAARAMNGEATAVTRSCRRMCRRVLRKNQSPCYARRPRQFGAPAPLVECNRDATDGSSCCG